ncbi:hypothetical protein PAXRUDRAFT_833761 [Paxillus rubicundulus Ve08.2h10]|uniref:Uncharacterized protein n=1 Tax=Paxillus rubicundulus Ve08.2h10 TaxID=930991 RepID=A0A0D0CWY4_9AGAM|nr:hypothetical protein PAXRUDRAFT_833761 [Paxillus rubicundulus Ve08.2h10]
MSNMSPLRQLGELSMDSPLLPPSSGSHDGSFSNELLFAGMMNQGPNTPDTVSPEA